MTGEMLLLIAVGFVVLAGIIVGTVIYLYFFRLWFRTHIAQCSLPLWTIFGMFLRGGNPQVLVNSYIDLHKSGMKVTVEELEGLAKDGGNVRKVAQAMVAAKRSCCFVLHREGT